MLDVLVFSLIFLSGLGAGFINAMAGSGSLLTLPALMLGGLDSAVANGTNRIGILVQSSFSLTGYASMGEKPDADTLYGALPVVVGAALGAYLTSFVERDVFRYVIDVIMLAMLVLICMKPSSWLRQRSEEHKPLRHKFWVIVLMFVAGLYAGFIQVASGYAMMAIMVLVGGMDLYRANTVKVVAQLANAAIVIPIYLYMGMIDWKLATILALGSGLGGWLGSRFSVRVGAKIVRYILMFGVSLYLLKELITKFFLS